MATKKKNPDRHKPSRMVRIPERVAAVMEAAGVDREASLAEMVKNACIAFLKAENRWPPSNGSPKR